MGTAIASSAPSLRIVVSLNATPTFTPTTSPASSTPSSTPTRTDHTPTTTPTSTATITITPTLTETPSPAPSETPTVTPTLIGGGHGQIAFDADIGGNIEIFIKDISDLNLDPVNITNNYAMDSNPSWSPDGKKIAFVSTRDGNPEIYLMNADGTNPINLTKHRGRDYEPSWSPDGSRIVFTSYRDSGNREIFVMDADGSNVIRLTEDPAYDSAPTWFPDGKRIVFSSPRRDPNPVSCDPCIMELYVINANGRDLHRLTNRGTYVNSPAVSPDGQWILVESTYTGVFDIYKFDSEGFNFASVTSGKEVDNSPSWSPDGKYICFITSDWLFISLPDGKGLQRIIDLPSINNPVWRP